MEAENDFIKFEQKGNSAAGTRIRKAMQDIKNLTKEIRNNVTEIKNEEKAKKEAEKENENNAN